MISAKLLLIYLLNSTNITGVDISQIDPDEAFCLAENIYYESKSEDIQGQFAVASVTLNRVNSPKFPDTICKVVEQSTISKIDKKPVCAFTWYCENNKKGKDIPIINKNGTINRSVVNQFQLAGTIAIKILAGEIEDNTNGATHFHNYSLSNPSWTKELTKTKVIGNHAFYK